MTKISIKINEHLQTFLCGAYHVMKVLTELCYSC